MFISLTTRKLIYFWHELSTDGKSRSITRPTENMANVNPTLTSTQIKAINTPECVTVNHTTIEIGLQIDMGLQA